MKTIDDYSFTRLLHRATHRIPGVPTHTERPAGHQGNPQQGRTRRHTDRQHRVLVAWQRRVAALFGQDL